MDLQGIPKRAYRSRILEAYETLTGQTKLPNDQCFFTLGGPVGKRGQIILDSELDQLIRRGFLKPKQYFSVEGKDRKIHAANMTVRGPTWLWGSLEGVFARWADGGHAWTSIENCPEKWSYLGVLHADLMSGPIKALPVVRALLDDYHGVIDADANQEKALLVFNMIQENRHFLNRGGESFPDVKQTIMSDSRVQWHIRRGMKLIDCHTYENKTVGKGSGVSKLTTLMFAY